MTENLETTVHQLTLQDFHQLLEQYGIQGFGYPAWYSTAPRANANDLAGTVSSVPGDFTVAVFSARAEEKRPIFDISLVSGSPENIHYLEAYSKLKRMLKKERIPFREDNVDIQKIRQEAIKYANSLLQIAESLE